jgi:DNA helicase II / ATP-dependent DNA helicase PcrA
MQEASFKEEFSKLNPSQKDAVSSIEGPFMVVAGPGTGKTQVLALRIANILLQTQMDPKNILALTFTESGVIAMRKRLLQIIGRAAYYVQIHTFHSFCDKAIREFPEKFIFSRELRSMSDVDRVICMQEIIDKVDLEHLTSFHNKYYFLGAISNAIKNLKREKVTVDDFEKIIDGKLEVWTEEKKDLAEKSLKYIQTEKELAKFKELASLYREYQKVLGEKGLYDFEDMILFVVDKMQNDEEFLRYYQELFQYILVDEYQDTNNAQNELIRLLGSFFDSPNIFVVGDDDQAIYRFQGASVENLLFLRDLYPNLKKIVLDSNYRSSQTILDASKSLIENNEQRISNIEKDVVKNLKAERDLPECNLELYEFNQGESENYFIKEKILELQKAGADLSEVAILVRDNRDFEDIADVLERSSIPYFLRSGVDILQEPEVRKIFKLLRLIENPDDNLLFFEVMLFDFVGADTLEVYKKSKETTKAFPDFLERIANWKKATCNMTFSEFFEYLLKDVGYIEYILKSEKRLDLLNKVNSLFSFVKNLNNSDHELSLKSFLEKIEIMEEHRLKVEEYMLKPDTESVQIMTVHKAKGLEFDYVFMPKLYDGKWGNKTVRELIKLPSELVPNTDLDKKEQNEDERRLFYVALTRAKKQVFLSLAKLYHVFGVERETVPSIFVSEIDDKFIDRKDVSPFQDNVEKLLSSQFDDKEEVPQKLTDYLDELINEFKLSVTAMDTYLDCKRKFLYNNLLRIPRTKTPALAFGTAVHKALELFFVEFKDTGTLPSKSFLIERFEKAMKREVLIGLDMEKALKKGRDILEGYYENYKDEFKNPMFLEYFFGKHNVYLDEIPLTGKLDKIEMLDPLQKKVKITDYKTGKPRSRNDIEGKTKSSDGRYKRQLNFYKILCEQDQLFSFDVENGEFDFIEPNPSGKFKKEEFCFEKKELDELKVLIKDTYGKIKKYKFAKTENNYLCKNCDYRGICGR